MVSRTDVKLAVFDWISVQNKAFFFVASGLNVPLINKINKNKILKNKTIVYLIYVSNSTERCPW